MLWKAARRWHSRAVDGLVTTLRIAFCLAIVALAAGATPAGRPFAGVPGVDLRYYDVSGRTPAEIRASLNRNNRLDPNTGARVDAYTAWSLDWRVPYGPDGRCRLDRAEVTLKVEVGLPRLVRTERVPPALLERWQRYRAALEAHEGTHARNAYQGRKAMLEAIHRADCAGADEAADDVMDALRRRNAEYDRLTRHGATEGAQFP